MATFPGPFCKELNITSQDLEDETNLNPIHELTNGLVLEINSYIEHHGKNSYALFNIISRLNSNFECENVKSLKTKVSRVCEQKKKLLAKKKVTGFKNVKELMSATFSPYLTTKKNEQTLICDEAVSKETIQQIENENISENIFCTKMPTDTQASVNLVDSDDDESLKKETNLLKYSNKKQLKQCQKLQKKIVENTEKLEHIKNRIGHYSVRNVNKRDETAKKNLHALRDLKRLVSRQEKQIKRTTEKLKESELKLEIVTNEKQASTDKIAVLIEEVRVISEKRNSEKSKILSLQKSNSYLRNEIKTIRLILKQRDSLVPDDAERSNTKCDNCEMIRSQILEKENKVAELEEDVDEFINGNIKTKNEDGSYNHELRLCVIELVGLEVAVEKVSPVIQSVLRHILGKRLDRSDLPNPTTTQAIVDEGHFIAKTFISEKLNQAENWGLGRDGTTRRKQKIVDTSITLDSGDVISLGFDRVYKENAVSINNVTKNHLNELGKLHANLVKKETEDEATFVARSLEKLSYTMSDRASNEKLANKLLDEWRDDVLKDFEGDKGIVHHFYCMAHVLLGFHSYTKSGMKQLETELVDSVGPVGRDALPVFQCWSKKETVIERVVRTTSEVFGPAGDHNGIRDKWDAHCMANGIKSVIGNYRDNRFNAVFETSAEVFMHRQDFIKVLETVDNPNLKLKSVLTDLKSDIVCTFLQCFGLFFMKLTGPYWNLITTGKVIYLDLSPHILEMKQFLKQCMETPTHLFNQNEHWSPNDPLDIGKVNHHQRFADCLFSIKEETRGMLLKTIVTVASAMIAVIDKQLTDFLDGGKFHVDAETISKMEEQRTNFAHVTNLGCEHHFGDLDSSQRRRPSASMHHHTSIQLLKRNRIPMMKWLSELEPENRNNIMLSARKGGREMRQDHISNEKNVVSEIHKDMVTKKGIKREGSALKRGKKNRHKVSDDSQDIGYDGLNYTFRENEYVAIAYQDSWYPGIVEEVQDEKTAYVKFMSPCRKDGYFQWPSRVDKQIVDKQFILTNKFIPDCQNSGRQWFIKEFFEIGKQYEKFKCAYF